MQHSKKKIVLIQGAFDILNMGHVKAFKRARALGDYLIVALNSDELLYEYKKRRAAIPYSQKKIIIESCRYVDKVIKATNFSPMNLLKKYDIDIYVLSREWASSKEEEINYMFAKGGSISYCIDYKGVIRTGQIKHLLLEEEKEGLTTY